MRDSRFTTRISAVLTATLAFGASLLPSACSFRAADLNRLGTSDDACRVVPEMRSSRRDLVFDFVNMNPHNQQHTTFDLRRQNGSLAARAVLEDPNFSADDPATAQVECTRFVFPQLVPPNSTEGSYSVEFWSDFSRNYSGRNNFSPDNTGMVLPDAGTADRDHTWRIDSLCDDGVQRFIHNTNFTDLRPVDPSGPFEFTVPRTLVTPALRLALSNRGVSINDFETIAWVRREQELQGVYVKRCLFPRDNGICGGATLGDGDSGFFIPNIIIDGNYTATVFIDFNGDRQPDGCDFQCTLDRNPQGRFVFNPDNCMMPTSAMDSCAAQTPPGCRAAMTDGGTR